MKQITSEPREVLKFLLGRVFRAKNRVDHLNACLAQLSDPLSAPIGGANYTPMPRAPRNGSDGPELSVLLKMNDLEEQIKAERARFADAYGDTYALIGRLPSESTERQICEMRHIRLLSWRAIASAIPMSRRHVVRIYDGALDALMAEAAVREIIEAAADEYRRWNTVRQYTRRRRT